MLKAAMGEIRRISLFEKLLLLVGLSATFFGFYLIKLTFEITGENLNWIMVVAIFSWLILLILFIVSGLNADVKEELSLVIQKHINETVLLKEINLQLLGEIKTLRKEMEQGVIKAPRARKATARKKR